MEEPATNLELRDIPDAAPFIPSPSLPWWAWLIIALILAIAIFFIVRKKSTPAVLTKNDAYREACTALDSLSSLATTPVKLATAVSLIMRRYLAAAASDPSLFETHEEFLSRHTALTIYPDDLRKEVTTHFQHIARLKYAPLEAAPDLTNFIPHMRALLDRLHYAAPSS